MELQKRFVSHVANYSVYHTVVYDVDNPLEYCCESYTSAYLNENNTDTVNINLVFSNGKIYCLTDKYRNVERKRHNCKREYQRDDEEWEIFSTGASELPEAARRW